MVGERGVGRPAVKSDPNIMTGLTFKMPGKFKNLCIDLAESMDMSITDLFVMLVLREAGIDSLDDIDN